MNYFLQISILVASGLLAAILDIYYNVEVKGIYWLLGVLGACIATHLFYLSK